MLKGWCVASLVLWLSVSASAQGLGVAGSLQRLSNGSARLQVQQVVAGSLAARVGLAPGDVILSINGLAPGDRVANERAIAAGRGLPVVLIERGGTRITLGDRRGPNGSGPIVTGPIGPVVPGAPGIVGPGIAHRPPWELIPYRKGPDLKIDLETTTGLSGSRVRVTGVARQGLGHLLGIRVGDAIDSVNRRPVSTIEEAAGHYIVSERRTIVLGVSRNGNRGQIRIDEPTLRRLIGNRPPGRPPRPRPPQVIKTPLDLKTFRRPDGKVTVAGGSTGLGNRMGISGRGTVILSVNGKPIRVPADLKRVDEAIAAGEVTSLTIRVIRPNRAEETVRFP